MPVPIIVAAAAAAAARLAAKKLAKEAAKKVAAKTTAKTAQIAKNSVVKKPAAKNKSNPPNKAKIEYKFGMGNNRMINKGVPLEARAAGGVGRKSRIQESKITADSARAANASKPKVNSSNSVKINSAKPTKGSSDNFVEVPVKDSKYGEGPGVFVSRAVAARKPTRKPTRNLENPPKGTVVIKSSSPSYLRKKAVPMKTPVVKKTPRKFAPPKKK